MATPYTWTGSDDATSDYAFECPVHRPLYPNLSLQAQSCLVMATFAYTFIVMTCLLKIYDIIERFAPISVRKFLWVRFTQSWPFVLGALVYLPLGFAHFTLYWDGHACIFPPHGSWGWYFVHGSPHMHVVWTGYFIATFGALLGLNGLFELIDDDEPFRLGARWWRKVSARALFAVTVAMTFVQAYMLTHGARINDSLKGTISLQAYMTRNFVQALFLSNLWYMGRRDNLGATYVVGENFMTLQKAKLD